MEEFTTIAIWLLIIYLAINSSILWFNTLDEFSNNGLGINGLQENNTFVKGSPVVINVLGLEVDCSTAQSNVFNFIPCSLANVTSTANQIKDDIWGLLTAWSNLLGAILPNPIGVLIKRIIGPIFGGIAIMGIFAILLRLAGIVRGGS